MTSACLCPCGERQGTFITDIGQCKGSEELINFNYSFAVNLNISIALEENDRSNASQGRLQLTTAEGVVGTISDQFWTIDDKNVICSQLGFPAGALWDEFYDFGPGTGPVLITDVRCTGFENLLVDCFYRVATGNEDDHRHDVGVVCNTTGYFGELESCFMHADVVCLSLFLTA